MNTINSNPQCMCIRMASPSLLQFEHQWKKCTVAVGALAATADSVNYIVESIPFFIVFVQFHFKQTVHLCNRPFVAFSLHLICSITYAHGCLNSCICKTWKREWYILCRVVFTFSSYCINRYITTRPMSFRWCLAMFEYRKILSIMTSYYIYKQKTCLFNVQWFIKKIVLPFTIGISPAEKGEIFDDL